MSEVTETTVRTYISYEGMGKHYMVKVGNVIVWVHSFAMDGPLDEEAERLFMEMHTRGEPQPPLDTSTPG